MKKPLITALITMTVCVCILFSGCDSVIKAAQGEEQTTLEFTTNRTEVADEKIAAAEYFASLIAAARAAGTGLSVETKFEIGDLKVVSRELEGKTDDNGDQVGDPSLEALNAEAKQLRDYIAAGIKGPSDAVPFGEDWGELAPPVPTPLYTSDGTCEVVTEVREDETVEIKDERRGTLRFADETYPLSVGSVIGPLIRLPDEDAIKAEMEKIADYIAVDDYGAVFTESRIEFSANRITDEIASAGYVTQINVTAHAHGVGSYESYGKLTVFFTLVSRTDYVFDWVDPDAAAEDDA